MKKEKKLIALDIAVCVALVLSCVTAFLSSLKSSCTDIKENVLRLHVIANSDSAADQSVKLEVRDAVLEASKDIFTEAMTKEDAERLTAENSELLEAAAKKVLEKNGYDYNASVEIGESYFPTREYGNITLPAGKYRAVRVILGKGEGHNWWCVMFPPMCISAAEGEEMLCEVLDDEAEALVHSGKKYEVRFKLVEWYESIKNAILN